MRNVLIAFVLALGVSVVGGGTASADPGLPHGPWIDPTAVTVRCIGGYHVLTHPAQPWAQNRCVAD